MTELSRDPQYVSFSLKVNGARGVQSVRARTWFLAQLKPDDLVVARESGNSKLLSISLLLGLLINDSLCTQP